MAHIRQSRPDSGLGFQVKVRKTFEAVPSSPYCGWRPEMCSGSEAGSYLRRIDFVYHSTLGLRVVKQKKRRRPERPSRATSRRRAARARGRSRRAHSGHADGGHVTILVTRSVVKWGRDCIYPGRDLKGPRGPLRGGGRRARAGGRAARAP